MSTKLQKFWREHDQKILIVLALALTAIVSFRAGQTGWQAKEVAKIDVSLNQLAAANPHQEKVLALGEAVVRKGIEVESSAEKSNTGAAVGAGLECVLVGSKNSDKFHKSSCQWASRIKQENRVCFASVEEAQKAGYQAAKCCH